VTAFRLTAFVLATLGALSIGALSIGASSTDAFAAGGAYQVDTADVGEPGNCRVESWVSAAGNHDFIGALSPACVIGFPQQPVEASVQLTRSRADGEWGSAATPKLKTNLIPTAIGSWGLAVSGKASYDLNTKETTTLAATLPATLRLSNVMRINLNAGVLNDRIAKQNYFTYGAGFDWRTPANDWIFTAEVFGQLGAMQETRGVTEPRFQVGLRWRPIDAVSFDIIYGRNLTGENSNWITLVNTVRFSAGK
jgi:hypothetical protein